MVSIIAKNTTIAILICYLIYLTNFLSLVIIIAGADLPDSGVTLGEGDPQANVGGAVVHGQNRVKYVCGAREAHAVEAVRGEQVARVLDDGCLWEPGGAAGVDVEDWVVVAGQLVCEGHGVLDSQQVGQAHRVTQRGVVRTVQRHTNLGSNYHSTSTILPGKNLLFYLLFTL